MLKCLKQGLSSQIGWFNWQEREREREVHSGGQINTNLAGL